MKQIRTTKEWNKIVETQKKSGLSVAGYARENDINPSTLQYWSKKITTSETAKLVKVDLKNIKTIKPTLLIINGIKLEIPSNISSEKITKIISVLREDI